MSHRVPDDRAEPHPGRTLARGSRLRASAQGVSWKPDGRCGTPRRVSRSSRHPRAAARNAACWTALLFASLAAATPAAGWTAETAEPPADRPSKLIDPEDGWFDVSGFLDESYGFVPFAIPVTEPALGYGAVLALVFIDKQPGAETWKTRPNLSVVGGLATSDGSRGWGALNSRYWRDGRLQTVVAFVDGELKLDYYGLGDAPLRDHPLPFALRPRSGWAQAKHRLGAGRSIAGLSFSFSSTRVDLEVAEGTPGLPAFAPETRLGAVTPTLAYDSRDNIFTPTRGLCADASVEFYRELLGSDVDFERAELIVLGYFPPHPRVFLGARASGASVSSDAPFYMHPFLYMRGIGVMRYLGDQTAQAELEVRYQFWKRVSLVGFGGAGLARSEVGGEVKSSTPGAGGTGLRYEVARKYGLHMGLDVAWGPDETAFYLQFGSAWTRL